MGSKAGLKSESDPGYLLYGFLATFIQIQPVGSKAGLKSEFDPGNVRKNNFAFTFVWFLFQTIRSEKTKKTKALLAKWAKTNEKPRKPKKTRLRKSWNLNLIPEMCENLVLPSLLSFCLKPSKSNKKTKKTKEPLGKQKFKKNKENQEKQGWESLEIWIWYQKCEKT